MGRAARLLIPAPTSCSSLGHGIGLDRNGSALRRNGPFLEHVERDAGGNGIGPVPQFLGLMRRRVGNLGLVRDTLDDLPDAGSTALVSSALRSASGTAGPLGGWGRRSGHRETPAGRAPARGSRSADLVHRIEAHALEDFGPPCRTSRGCGRSHRKRSARRRRCLDLDGLDDFDVARGSTSPPSKVESSACGRANVRARCDRFRRGRCASPGRSA